MLVTTTPQTTAYLTYEEAAEAFGLCVRTLKRLTSLGTLTRHRQHGRREVLLAREELQRVLAPQPVSA